MVTFLPNYLLLYGSGFIIADVVPPIIYQNIINTLANGITPGIEVIIKHLLLLLLGAIALREVLFRLADFVITYFQSHVMRELANSAFTDLSRRSYHFFTNAFIGGLVAKSRRFVSAFETLHDVTVYQFLSSFMKVVGVFTVLLWTHLWLGVFFLLWFLAYLILTVIFVRKTIPFDLKESAEDSHVTAALSDAMSNILNIKMFASRKIEGQRFQKATFQQHMARARAWYFGNFTNTFQGFFLAILELGGMYLVLSLWLSGDVSAGTVVLMQAYVVVISRGLWDLGKSMTRFAKAFTDAAEMVEIFEKPIEVLDPVVAEKPKITRGEVKFSRVTFGYNPTRPVLKSFSLTIKAGERVGLVGSSGAGKTTITKLLLRFADPQTGKITIDGQNIVRITQNNLRRHIAYVPQEPVLFHRSLEENIAYGKPGVYPATGGATLEEIIEAAKKAHAHEFISSFPEGYATLVGERGIKLSGGERQRIAIARAILKNAPILVLDEATSSLDTLSEGLIQEALEELMRSKTVIIIAHRLSTVRKMERIIVLDENGIVEEGSHENLLAANGTYAAFWNHQTDGLLA